MTKNLKKVISAVAALAISASAVSAFAVNFPDVAEDASYAQAVQELSSLNIISGFEDGTFRPDELVTRAQMSKMIVDALAETAQAEASKANSQFNDVSENHWAKGYINQGVADGFIAGYSSTEFGPDDNVTYVQAQKMLVSAIGYETYAQNNGGWPNGYKQWAASQGITDGITGIADDTQLTRAQVAQLIDNAMDAPICVIQTYDTTWNGGQVPKLEIKDTPGGDGYQTLFTKKHDAYKVYGRVTGTSKTANIDTDQVNFRVEKADNFDKEYIGSSSKADRATREETMYFGDTKANDMERTYAQALIQKDSSNDEFTILSIVAAAANKSVSVVAEDLDEASSAPTGDTPVLYFYPAGTTRNSVKYEFVAKPVVYVNGVETSLTLQQAYDTYMKEKNGNVDLDNDKNVIEFQKETTVGSTSTNSKYNVVMITTYATAVVDEVIDKNDYYSINFSDQSSKIDKTSLRVEKDDDTKTYSFTLDGAAIEPTDLQENDVLTITFDVIEAAKQGKSFADSDFYDVIVSRDTAEGKYTGHNSDNTEFTVGNVKYKTAIDQRWAESTEYTLYLDIFGRVAYVDEVANSKKVGILKSVYRKNNGDYVAELFTKEGTLTEYTMDYGTASNGGAQQIATVFGGTVADGDTYKSGLNANLAAASAGTAKQKEAAIKKDYVAQVVEYKVSGSGKLTVQKFYNTATVTASAKYRESSDRIGSYKISDATTILDLSGVSESKKDAVKLISRDTLRNDAEYDIAAYDSSNSIYRFVVVTDGFGGIDSASQIAIFKERGSDENADEEQVITVTAYVNDEEVTLVVDNDEVDAENAAKALNEGDPFVYSVNGSGDIDEIMPLLTMTKEVNGTDVAQALGDYTYNEFKTAALGGKVKLAVNTNPADKNIAADLSDNEEDVSAYFGVLVRDGKAGYKLLTNFTTDAQGYVDLDTATGLTTSGAKVYTYNFKNNPKNAGRLSYGDSIAYTPDVKAAYSDGQGAVGKYNLNADNVRDDVVFAVVRAYNEDDVQEIYLIINE